MKALIRAVTDAGLKRALAFLLRRWIDPYLESGLSNEQVTVESSEGRAKLLNIKLDCSVLNSMLSSITNHVRLVCCELREVELELHASARKGIIFLARGVSISLEFTSPTQGHNATSAQHPDSVLQSLPMNGASDSAASSDSQAPNSILVQAIIDRLAVGGIWFISEDIHVTLVPEVPTEPTLELQLDKIKMHVTDPQGVSNRSDNLNVAVSSVLISPLAKWQFKISEAHVFIEQYELASARALEFSISTFSGLTDTVSSDAFGRMRCGSAAVPGAVISSPIKAEICITIHVLKTSLTKEALVFLSCVLSSLPVSDENHTDTAEELDGNDASEEEGSTVASISDESAESFYSTVSQVPHSCSTSTATETVNTAILFHISIDCFEFDWKVDPALTLSVCAGVVAADVAVLKSAMVCSISCRSLRVLEVHATHDTMCPTESFPILTFSSQPGVPDATVTTLWLSQEPAAVSVLMASTQVLLNLSTILLLQSSVSSSSSPNTNNINAAVRIIRVECLSVEITITDGYCEGNNEARSLPVLQVVAEGTNISWEMPRDILIKLASISVLVPNGNSCAPLLEMRGTTKINPISARCSSDGSVITISCATCAANLDLLLDGSNESQILQRRIQALLNIVKTDDVSEPVDSETAATVRSQSMELCWNSLHLAVDESVLYLQIGPYDTTTVNLSADMPVLELRSDSRSPLLRPLTQAEHVLVERQIGFHQSEATHLDMKWANNIDFSSLIICLTNIMLFGDMLATAITSLSNSSRSSSTTATASSTSSSNSSKNICLQLQAVHVLADIGQGILLGLESIGANSSDISGGAQGSSTYLNLGKANIYVRNSHLLQGEAVLVGTFSAASMELTKPATDEEEAKLEMSEGATELKCDSQLDVKVESLCVIACLDALLVLSASVLALGGSGPSSPSQARRRTNPVSAQRPQQGNKKPRETLMQQYSLLDSLIINGQKDSLSLDMAHSVQLPARWLPAYTTDTGNGSKRGSSEDGFVSWSDDSATSDSSEDFVSAYDNDIFKSFPDVGETQSNEQGAQQINLEEVLQQFEEMELMELPSRARPHASGYPSMSSTHSNQSGIFPAEDTSPSAAPTRTIMVKSHDAWARNAHNSAIDLGAGRWLLPLESIPLFPLHFTAPARKALPLEQQPPSHASPSKTELELPVRMRIVFKTNFRLCLKSGQSSVRRSDKAKEGAILRLDAAITVTVQLYDQWMSTEGADYDDAEEQIHSRTSICLGGLLIVLEPSVRDGVPRRIAGPWRARTTISDTLSSIRVSLLTTRLFEGKLEHSVGVQLQPMRVYIDGPLLEFLIALPSEESIGGSSSSKISSVSVAVFPLKIDHSASLPSLSDLQLHLRGKQSICTALLPLLRLFPLEGLILTFPLIKVDGSAVVSHGGGLVGAAAAVSSEWITLIPSVLAASYPISMPTRDGSFGRMFISSDNLSSTMPRHLLSTARDVSGGVLHVTHRLALGAAKVLRIVAGAHEKPKNRLQIAQPRTIAQGVSRGMSALNSQLKGATIPLYEVSRQNRRAPVDAFSKTLAYAGAVPQALLLPVAGSVEALGLLLQGMRNSLSPARAVEEEDRYKCNVSVYPFNPET